MSVYTFGTEERFSSLLRMHVAQSPDGGEFKPPDFLQHYGEVWIVSTVESNRDQSQDCVCIQAAPFPAFLWWKFSNPICSSVK